MLRTEEQKELCNKQQREKYVKTNETEQLVAVAILKEFREAKLKVTSELKLLLLIKQLVDI
jgi:hypothetical protein